MANNNFSNFFSAPKNKSDAEKQANKLINGLKAEEKTELQEILSDRDKIMRFFPPLPLRKLWKS